MLLQLRRRLCNLQQSQRPSGIRQRFFQKVQKDFCLLCYLSSIHKVCNEQRSWRSTAAWASRSDPLCDFPCRSSVAIGAPPGALQFYAPPNQFHNGRKGKLRAGKH